MAEEITLECGKCNLSTIAPKTEVMHGWVCQHCGACYKERIEIHMTDDQKADAIVAAFKPLADVAKKLLAEMGPKKTEHTVEYEYGMERKFGLKYYMVFGTYTPGEPETDTEPGEPPYVSIDSIWGEEGEIPPSLWEGYGFTDEVQAEIEEAMVLAHIKALNDGPGEAADRLAKERRER